jgi:hypothetical protein
VTLHTPLPQAIRSAVALLEARRSAVSKGTLREALETLAMAAAPTALASHERAAIAANKARAERLRPFIVEADPLLSVHVWAHDEDDASARACEQLARDDFSDVVTCSEIGSNVQSVRIETDAEDDGTFYDAPANVGPGADPGWRG